MNIEKKITFYNQVMNRGAMRQMLSRLVHYLGNNYTAQILDQLKALGFRYATETGISLGIDDLLTTPSKKWLIQDAEYQAEASINQCQRGSIHAVEKLRQVVETWHITSEYLKHEMSFNFKITDPLNPVHMMSFSGARGSVSQVHQLVGMRGLMADPQGQIIDLPIQSNLREGLSLTEYIISCYGARKGVVDTAIRTADAGYLTRRLVEVAQNVIVNNTDCGTQEGIQLYPLKSYSSSGIINLPLEERLIGRVTAKTLIINNRCIIPRNQDIGAELAQQLGFYKKKVIIRSPLTCASMPRVCRLCYGWDLSYGNLVELGEAIGIVAGQSIGEPGTQLTLRTFHTGGVFSGDVAEHVRAPYNGIINFETNLIKPTRNRHGKPAWVCSFPLEVIIRGPNKDTILIVPAHSLLLVKNKQFIHSRQIIAEVRATTSPLKEKVSKGIYSDIQGEIFLQKKFYCISSFLLQKIVKLYPINAGYLWIKSYRILTFSSKKKIHLSYYDQDHIYKNIILGTSFNKFKILTRVRNNCTGIINISRYNLSNINKKITYQSILIQSIKDKLKYRISSFTKNYTNTQYTSKKNISFYSQKKNQKSSIINQINEKNQKKYFKNIFLLMDHKNTLNSQSFYKGLLGTSYKIYQTIYKMKNLKNNLILNSLNYPIALSKIQKIYLKFIQFSTFSEFHNYKYTYCQMNFVFFNQSQTSFYCIQNRLIQSIGNFSSDNIPSINTKYSIDTGRVIAINNHYIILHLNKLYLTTPKGNIYVHSKETVTKGKTLLSLIYERLKTSDITQGLPKAEQLLEARPNNEVSITLQQYFEDWTTRIRKYLLSPYSIFTPKLVQHSQIDLVNRIQAVYLAQGVFTSDKHIEVIVRQMTSKVIIVEYNDPTAISSEGVIRWSIKSKTQKMSLYLPGELIELKQAQRVYRALEEPLPYKPLLLGVTKASLNTESFISEASFERTANVLSKSAFEGRIDWMKGLKENIIFGGIIPTGTGSTEKNWENILLDFPQRRDTSSQFFLKKIYNSKIGCRLSINSFSKHELNSNLRQSIYSKYNYSKYSSLILNTNPHNFLIKNSSENSINNEIFML